MQSQATMEAVQQTILAQVGAWMAAMEASLVRTIRHAANEQRQGRNQTFDEVTTSNFEDLVSPSVLQHVRYECPPSTATIGEWPEDGLSSSDLSMSQDVVMDITPTPLATLNSPPLYPNTSPCPPSCNCSCHPRAYTQVPTWLALLVGRISFPRTLLSLFGNSSGKSRICDNSICQRTKMDLLTIKWHLPSWFARVEASVRFESFPIHFLISTPRIVPDLWCLYTCSLDGFKRMLSTREVTLHDIQEDGSPLLFVSILVIQWNLPTRGSKINRSSWYG